MWKPSLIETARMKYLGIVKALEADTRAGRVAAGCPPKGPLRGPWAWT